MNDQEKSLPQNKVYYIYLITNKVNNKKYIGWSNNPKKRWAKHIWEAFNESNYYLHRAIKKYGIENFSLGLIYQGKDGKHIRDIMEPYYIKLFETFMPNGYNMTRGGEGIYGYNHTIETRKKQSETRKHKLKTGEIVHGKLGTHHSKETLNRIFIKKAKLYKLTFRNDKTITIKGINTWARNNGYDASNLHNVLTGKRCFHKDIIKVERID